MRSLEDILCDWEDAVKPEDQSHWDFLVNFDDQLRAVLSCSDVKQDTQSNDRAKAILAPQTEPLDACAYHERHNSTIAE